MPAQTDSFGYNAAPTKQHGYNVALEYLKAHGPNETLKNKELHEKIDSLDTIHGRLKTIHNAISALTHEQKEHKKANFSSNAEVRAWIDELYAMNPKIFESGNEKTNADPDARYIFKDEEAIKVVTQALDGETKLLTVESNKILMEVQHKYSDSADLVRIIHDGIKAEAESIRALINGQKSH